MAKDVIKDEETVEADMKARRTSSSTKEQRMVEAFAHWSIADPPSFSALAPDLLRQGIYRTIGNDPFVTARLEAWLNNDWRAAEFSEVFNLSERASTNEDEAGQLQPSRFKGERRDWLETLGERFSGDHRRWDAAKRDQFILLGMISMHAGGTRQGIIGRYLGIDPTEQMGVTITANVIRASKIALTRLAHGAGIEDGVFAPASGDGLYRMHRMRDPGMATLTARFIADHPASALIPHPSSVQG